MYYFFIDGVLLPVTPEKLSTKIKNQNKTMNLINDGEINILKDAGLTEVEFDTMIPAVKYPFAHYSNGFINPSDFLDLFEKLKTEKKPFQFIVTRTRPEGSILFNTNLTVSMESYTVKESANNGMDLNVSIKLKQFKPFGTKIVKVVENTVSEEPERLQTNSPEPKQEVTYTVVSGDCLWSIAQKFYGDGSKFPLIYEANKDLIDAANKKTGLGKYGIYPAQVLTIPEATNTGQPVSAVVSNPPLKDLTLTITNSGSSECFGTYQVNVNGAFRRGGVASDYSTKVKMGSKIEIIPQSKGKGFSVGTPDRRTFTMTADKTFSIRWFRL